MVYEAFAILSHRKWAVNTSGRKWVVLTIITTIIRNNNIFGNLLKSVK